MPTVDPVILELQAKLDNYERNLTHAQRLSDDRLGKIEKRGKVMSSRVEGSFSMAARSALAFAASVGAVAAAREFLQIADTAKGIEAQLRLATKEFGSYAQAQEDVRRISSTTRTELEATAKLYGNFTRNAGELGITQAEAARATETVGKAFKISGASAAESSQGVRQLVQGLQSGTLRGDEFNTIMEAAPRLAKLFADSLGVPVGALRKMAEEGELTSAMLTRAFTNKEFTAEIDAEFRQMPVTFDEAMQQLENAATITFGAFDRGGQFSTMLANFVTDGSNGFADLEAAAEAFGATVASEFAGIAAIFGNAITELSRFKAVFDSLGGGSGVLDRAQGVVGGVLNPLGTLLELTPAYREARDKSLGEGALRRIYSNDPLEQWRSETGRQAPGAAPRGTPAARAGGAKPGRKGRAGASADTLARRAEQERTRALRDDFNAQRDQARMDDEIIAAKAALATAATDILAFELQQIDSQKAQRLAQLALDEQLGDLTAEQAAKMREDIETIADLNNQRAMRAFDEIAAANEIAQFRDDADTLQAEAQLVRARGERAEIEQRILDLAYQEEEASIRRAAANGQIAHLDDALANMKRRQLAEQEALARANMSPGQRFLSDLQDEAENLGDAYEDIAVRGLQRMTDAFGDATTKALGLHGILGDIIGDFIKLAARQAMLKGLDAIWGALAGGGGGALANSINTQAMGNVSAILGARATGGPVASGGAYLVGENGPELLQMGSRSGFVVPNNLLGAARGGAGVVQHVTIQVDAKGALLAGHVEQMVRSGMAQSAQLATAAGASEGERRVMTRARRRLPS